MQHTLVYNWKTYVPSEDHAQKLVGALEPSAATIIICPSAVHIPSVRESIQQKGMHLGAQDINVSRETPQTGALSGEQIHNAGARFVIIGHAETRANGVENTAVVRKVEHAIHYNLTPIICLSEQKKNKEHPGDEVVAQLEEIIESGVPLKNVMLAYEPTAYIGAEKPLDTPTIQGIVGRLRDTIPHTTPIMYGGSVTKENAETIIRDGGVDGFLLGRASVNAEQANSIATYI